MVRVMLLNPPSDDKYVKEGRCQHKAAVFSSVYPPMTLAYMASMIRDRADVMLIDAMGQEIGEKDALLAIRSFKPDILVVNTTTPTYSNDMQFLSKARDYGQFISIVYGVHATSMSDEVLMHEGVDAIIKCEPEETLSDIIDNGLDVPGVEFSGKEGIVKNPKREQMDVNDLPIPAWELLDLSKYRLPVTNEKYLLVTTGRGCPYNCSFCVAQPYYGSKYRKRSVEKIIMEIEHGKALGVRDFFFFSETFTLDNDHIIELCNELIKKRLDIRWVCNSRVDTVNEKVLSLMKKAGCWMISFGIESSNQKILDEIGKGIKVEQIMKATFMASRAGLSVVGHFILGLPGDTRETVEETIRFSLKLPIHFAEYYSCTPFPGSRLYEEYKSKDSSIDYSKFEYSSNILNPELDIEAARDDAYKRFYLRPYTIINMLRIFGLSRLPVLIRTGIKFISNI